MIFQLCEINIKNFLSRHICANTKNSFLPGSTLEFWLVTFMSAWFSTHSREMTLETRNKNKKHNLKTNFSNGCLGSHNDEERSEMRYVLRIAKPRESSKLWTHIALLGSPRQHACLSVSKPHSARDDDELIVVIALSGFWCHAFIHCWLHPSDFLWEIQHNLDCVVCFCRVQNFVSQRNVRVNFTAGCDDGYIANLMSQQRSKQVCTQSCSILISAQARRPAEFKHIIKRRTRN